MDLSTLSTLSVAETTTRQTAAKAWSSALTSLATAGIAWGVAYATGSKDPSVAGAITEALNNLFLIAVTTGIPTIMSYYVTYHVPNKPIQGN
jgi:hypothetical protein